MSLSWGFSSSDIATGSVWQLAAQRETLFRARTKAPGRKDRPEEADQDGGRIDTADGGAPPLDSFDNEWFACHPVTQAGEDGTQVRPEEQLAPRE